MTREEKIGAALGVAGGMLGLLFLATLYLINEEADIKDMPSFLLTAIVGLSYSAFFGRRAGRKINKRGPLLVGLISTALTNICSILTLGILGAAILQDVTFLGGALFGILFSFAIGGVPMLLIGTLYGYGLKHLIKTKY